MKEHNLKLDEFILDEIESIELIGEQETIDITVEDTHMFYCNDIYTHNSGLSADIVETNQIGGSIKKAQIGHFILSIAKPLDQRKDGTATIAILKSRFGKDGMIFKDILFDNKRMKIEFESPPKTQKEYKKVIDDNNIKRINEVLGVKPIIEVK
jgi:hypothetical protein